ncbi:hypothetical protein HON86_00365 [Candidatus Woesearchaeota archaeon]|nr:hypothetical protein [archaeon]MBT4648399.1 hypothetical protein [archaeon]MBT4835060.1 hypothetical protein [Candidatus Woesearchaeota archaeon]
MAGSYEKINYSIRPAKSIMRKILLESFRRLNFFYPFSKYQYVGFGSTYFTDFSVVHKSLGISNMISIEKESADKKRFKFNKPFSCIDIKFGHSNDMLLEIDWKKPTILWLDYDGKLSNETLVDINHFFTSAVSGSVIIITVNSTPPGKEMNRLAALKKQFTNKIVPYDTREKDIPGDGTSKIYQKIITNQLEKVLNARNAPITETKKKLQYAQLYNLIYKDTAKMLTVGGILYSKSDSKKFKKCLFNKLNFVNNKNEPVKITTPILTYREIRYLDKFLPGKISNSNKSIPSKEKKKYKDLYKYYPVFAETEL